MLIMSQFVENIRDLMTYENLSQKSFAEKIGVNYSTVSYWLKGTKLPDVQSVIKIAKAYSVSADYILGMTDDSTCKVSSGEKTFFDRFPQLLKDSPYNKNQLANALGIGNSTISKWILHQRMPSTDKVARLCDLLSCSVDYLIGRSDVK